MLRSTRWISVLVAAGAAAGLAGCTKDAEPRTSAVGDGGAALPAGLFVGEAPEGAVGVVEAKGRAAAGEEITVRGRIGGSGSPFVVGRAVFTIVDAGLASCADSPEDSCTTPWDYCCETRADITRHAATIRVVDDEGQPLRVEMSGAGLSPLAEVIVVGRVSQAEGDVLVVDATRIHAVGG